VDGDYSFVWIGITRLHSISFDRSKEACHGFLFHLNGCSYLAKGKPCPFSHDPKIGMVAAEAAKNNLLKMQK